jgi:DNA-binding NarL/FixJ family response regulator
VQDVNVAKRLLIVDDDARFRKLLRMVLEDAPEFEVIGEAEQGSSALTAARELAPDVVLLDVNLPDTTGFELTPQLMDGGSAPVVVLTSSRGDATYEQLAEEAGAAGFVSKHELSAAAISRALA